MITSMGPEQLEQQERIVRALENAEVTARFVGEVLRRLLLTVYITAAFVILTLGIVVARAIVTGK